MNRVELKNWAKEKIKGHILELLIPILIAGAITSLQIGGKFDTETLRYSAGFPIGFFLYFVNIGLVHFILNFINEKEHELKDLFAYSKDYLRIFITGLLQIFFTFLWGLLFIIPGIIKALAYSMISLILEDEKYNTLQGKEILKKSEEMMEGHKLDYLILNLSFIGWHILAIFTLGLLEIWIIPYETIASYKFLIDIKSDYEKNH